MRSKASYSTPRSHLMLLGGGSRRVRGKGMGAEMEEKGRHGGVALDETRGRSYDAHRKF